MITEGEGEGEREGEGGGGEEEEEEERITRIVFLPGIVLQNSR